ncbi:hypothetical protein [Streptomyces sp. NPDC054783]
MSMRRSLTIVERYDLVVLQQHYPARRAGEDLAAEHDTCVGEAKRGRMTYGAWAG